MILILLSSSVISLAYIILIGRFIKAWNNIPEYLNKDYGLNVQVSVIIAFRNEEHNLHDLLRSLDGQSYPKSAYEILFVDDHSEDCSASIVNDYITSVGNVRLISLGKSDFGKKKALAIAASEAKGELLIFTDADCMPHKNWLSTIVSFYNEQRPVLIASPVVITDDGSFFNRVQSLEFFSLVGATAATFGIGVPIMLNGANMAVKRDIYLENINSLQQQTPSGDDIFLLLQLKKRYPGRLAFLKSRNAVVNIKAHLKISVFFQQRLRWTSKSRFYKDKSIILTAIVVLLINLCLLNCFIMSFFNSKFIFIGGAVFIIKSLIDYIFLRRVLIYFNVRYLLKIFVLSQFLYFLYISITGIAGHFIPSKWKGRKVKIA